MTAPRRWPDAEADAVPAAHDTRPDHPCDPDWPDRDTRDLPDIGDYQETTT